MATRTWTSTGSTDMDNTANYSGSGSFATDDLVFNNTSVVDASATAPMVCNSVTIATTYTGGWSLYGQTLTVAGNISDAGNSKSHDYGNAITLNGASSTFSTLSYTDATTSPSMVSTALNCDLTFNSTTAGVLTNNQGYLHFKSLTLGADTTLTSNGLAYGLRGPGPMLNFTSSRGSYTNSAACIFRPNTDSTVWSMTAGSVWAGGSLIEIATAATYADTTVTIPALTYTGSSAINIDNNYAASDTGYNVAYNFTGAWSSPTNLTLSNVSNKSSLTFNTNGNAITCAALSTGNSVASTHTVTLNAGASVITCASWTGLTNNSTYINLSSSQWTVTGDITLTSAHIIDVGSSLFTFTGSSTVSIPVTAVPNFYDVVVNNASKAFAWASATDIKLHNLTTTAMTSYTHVSKTLTASGDVLFNGSGTLNLGNGITMNGASGTLTFGSTLGTVTSSSCALTFNGTTGCQLIDNKSCTFKSITLGANANLTNSPGINSAVLNSSAPLIFTNGGTLTINRQITFYNSSTGNSTFIAILAGVPTINGTSNMIFRASGSGGTISVPGITFGGTLHVLFTSGSGTPNNVILAGNIIGNDIRFEASNVGTTFTFSTNNFNVTCNSLDIGSTGATVTGSTINFGSSIINIGSFNPNSGSYNYPTTVNMQTSQWTCSGDNWIWNSTHTINHQWDQVTFTNTLSINSYGQFFNCIVLNAPAKTITLSNDIVCHGYQNIAGTLNKNGKQFSILGDCQMVKIEQTGAV